MANTPQATKRVRQTNARHEQQKGQASAMRTAVKKAEAAIAAGEEHAEELVQAAIKKIDKAVSKGLIHKNKAAREKSRLHKNLK